MTKLAYENLCSSLGSTVQVSKLLVEQSVREYREAMAYGTKKYSGNFKLNLYYRRFISSILVMLFLNVHVCVATSEWKCSYFVLLQTYLVRLVVMHTGIFVICILF